MRLFNYLMLSVLFGFVSLCQAQQYEFGALGGFGAASGLSAKSASGASADTGISSGIALGVFFGDNLYGRIGGELRYLYRASALQVESGGEKATLSGRSHIFHYDIVVHTKPPGEGVRPFVAVGIGVRHYQGTGVERAFQPLSEFVLLTQTSETRPLLSIGGGVKWTRENGMSLRFEVRDYVTPAPKEVLFPAPGGTVNGWLHDIIPQVGIAYTF